MHALHLRKDDVVTVVEVEVVVFDTLHFDLHEAVGCWRCIDGLDALDDGALDGLPRSHREREYESEGGKQTHTLDTVCNGAVQWPRLGTLDSR